MIVIAEYGSGNQGSILNMLRKIGAPVIVSSSVDDIEKADKLILPGVGAFDNGIAGIGERGLAEVLTDKVVRRKTPILGICLGMQIMGRSSEEGNSPGLGWVDAEVVRFDFSGQPDRPKIPHMGWNSVKVEQDDLLFQGLQGARFYFVHSYHVRCHERTDILSLTHYGHGFVSAFRQGNIRGAQFHPEKSHRFGLQFLKNFVEAV